MSTVEEEEQKVEGNEIFTTGVNIIVTKKEKEKEKDIILPPITKPSPL